MFAGVLLWCVACIETPAAPPSEPPQQMAVAVDTAAPPQPTTPETAVTDASESLVRAHAATALSVPESTLTVRRTSSRGLSAWRAFVDGETRGPGRKLATAVVRGDTVYMGRAGFSRWLADEGREDPVATAIALHVLVNTSDSEPYGSWTRGRRQSADPAYNADGDLVFFHSEPRRGSLMRSTVHFAEDNTFTVDSVMR